MMMSALTPKPKQFEPLEARRLLAVRTVDFDDYQIRFDQLNFLMRDVGPNVGGLNYTLGTGDGQRTARHGVTWPDANYYNATLGAGGFDALNTWPIKPVIIYTAQKDGNWLTGGWNLYQDMAEGPACVDDTARGATALIEDYLRNGTESSFQRARDALTFISYLMARDGRMYNFVFLDGPTYFNWDPIQAQNKHYGYRAEYVKRTQYPPGTGSTSWINQFIDPQHIVGYPDAIQYAPAFLDHPRFSIYMNDLRDVNNNDVAATWWGPIYTSSGEPNGVQSDRMIKQTYTTSTQRFGFEETRTVEAYGKAMLMLAKRAATNGGLTPDETQFARFIENHANRLLRYVQSQSLTIYDSKLQSVLLAGLVDYYRVMHMTSPYGPYTPQLPANSNTPETIDDRLTGSQIMTMIDTLATDVRGELLRTSDWRNGIFISNTAGNWAAWGEFQIAGLSKAYQLKRALGQSGAIVEALLDDAVYAAENFYGKEGWHYAAPGVDNVRTKERTNLIQGWNALYHTNSDQSGYYNSSIVHGLAELAEAYAISGRPDAVAKRDLYLDYMKTAATWWIGNNNMRLDVYDGQDPVAGTTRGRGASFDGIAHGNGQPWFNRNSGGESNIEGLRTMVVVKDVLERYDRPTTFAFEVGPNVSLAPTVTSESFDVNARAVRFRFSEDVGASVGFSDITIVNTDTNAEVPRANMSIAYNVPTNDLTFKLTQVLPDGQYRATLSGVGIVDNQSNVMLADRVIDFHVLAGDANRDGTVNLQDFNILAANFGQSPRTFTQGDFNYDGTVNLQDFNILAIKFGQSVPPATGTQTQGGAPGEMDEDDELLI
jgi:hypothetical protein